MLKLRPVLSAALGAAFLVGTAVVPVTSASAEAVHDDSQWHAGESGFNTRFACTGFPAICNSFILNMSAVDYQRIPGNPGEYPRVGERFYLHLETAIVYPSEVVDTYRFEVILPEGLEPAVKSASEVLCGVTDLDYTYTRALTCSAPSRWGASWVLPGVALARTEMANYWFPVVASKTFTGSDGPNEFANTIMLTSRGLSNPAGASPNPVVATVPLTVNPAARVQAPAKVAGFKASAKGRKVVLAWKRPTAPVTGFRLQVSTTGKKWISVGAVGRNAVGATWTKGKPGKTYYFRIAAVRNTVVGPWSGVARVRIR